jgi:hypothetical protein
MSDEIYTELVIFSDTLIPDQINTFLGMTCDKSRLKGDTIGRSIIRAKSNEWIIYSRVPRNTPLSNHIEDLLDRVSPVIEKIRNLVDRADIEVELNCVIYVADSPAMFFTREQVATIGKMGAGVDIDLYILPKKRGRPKTKPA